MRHSLCRKRFRQRLGGTKSAMGKCNCTPCAIMNRYINLLVAASLVGACCASGQTGPQGAAAAPVRVHQSWTVFQHPGYGYALPVPPGVRAMGEPEAAAEVTFVSQDGSFVMRAWGGLSPWPAADVFEGEWRNSVSQPGRSINYQRKARSWFVVSGTDAAGTEFYEKFTMRGAHVAAFALTYPRSRLREFDPWVVGIEKGFRLVGVPSGRLAVAPRLTPEGSPRLKVASNAAREAPRKAPSQVSRSAGRSPAQPKATAAAGSSRTGESAQTAQTSRTTEASTPPKEEPAKDAVSAANAPLATRVVGKPGFVYSPFQSDKMVDVQGMERLMTVRCPYTKKIFRVP